MPPPNAEHNTKTVRWGNFSCGLPLASYFQVMPVFYDTHAHLSRSEFAEDLPEVMARAAAAGITKIVTIATDLASSVQAIKLAEENVNVFAVVGWHPSHALEAPGGFAGCSA